nr:ribonuclease H-like domain-containing protein [Tanacetum cinerariifolium]
QAEFAKFQQNFERLLAQLSYSNCGLLFNGGNCPSCNIVGAGNEFVHDPNPFSYDNTPNFYDQPPHHHVETYSCELCGKFNSLCFVFWHQRLGHPANPVLDVLKGSLNLDSQTTPEHLCDTCNKAKQTREPFPLSDHKYSKIDELVHLDVWGPYKITSRDGFRYFLTIVDDFTRAVWVYMLKGKDDVYDSILSYSNCGLLFNGGNCPSCSIVGAGNEFVHDLNPFSYDNTPNFYDQPPHHHVETYACELCGKFNSLCFVFWHQRLGHPADPVLDVLKAWSSDRASTPHLHPIFLVLKLIFLNLLSGHSLELR